MDSPPFIEFATHPDIILNVSQIVSIEKIEVVLSGQNRKVFKASGIVHAIGITLSGSKNIELEFESEELCAATLKMLKIALKPFVVKEPGLAKQEKPKSLRTGKRSPNQL